jgi:hypothetical protein
MHSDFLISKWHVTVAYYFCDDCAIFGTGAVRDKQAGHDRKHAVNGDQVVLQLTHTGDRAFEIIESFSYNLTS